MSKHSVIITAGGIGRRMQSALPKQFILVNEKPILMYTIECFYHFDPKIEIILTLPHDWFEYWEGLVAEFDFRIPHKIVEGGKQRYDSIKNALKECSGTFVSVHDGVRPLVNEMTLKNCFKGVQEFGAVIPVVSIVESIRMKTETGTKAVDRSQYLIVQTPQSFHRDVLEKAYELPYHSGITDDASLVEEAGFEIVTVSGNEENIKITAQSDLKYAKMFLK